MEERWTLPQYYKMLEHWRAVGPPVHVSVGAYLGLAKGYPSGTDSTGAAYGDLEELEMQLSGSGGVIS